MNRIVILTLMLFCSRVIWAVEIDTNLFYYDKAKVETELTELSNLEKYLNENPQATDAEIISIYPDLNKMKSLSDNSLINYPNNTKTGNSTSFWFTFLLSAIGTYFIYGAVVGPISVAIVYFSTHKSKIETKKAIWGWIIGTIVGLGLWAVFHLI